LAWLAAAAAGDPNFRRLKVTVVPKSKRESPSAMGFDQAFVLGYTPPALTTANRAPAWRDEIRLGFSRSAVG
jgi:hypothetical protein